MKILAVGGGSGGHVTPIVAVINELAKSDPRLSVDFVCDKAFSGQAGVIMQGATVPVEQHIIQAGKLRRYKHFRAIDYITTPKILVANSIDIAKTAIGFVQSFVLLYKVKPDVVFAKGGYVCLPVGFAARLMRIPLVIHDSDARPGLTNRLLAPYAAAIATGYPLENYSYDSIRSHYTGVPIRPEFRLVSDAEQTEYKRKIKVPKNALLVVATGGGLGARAINSAMVAAAPRLLQNGRYLYIITGKKNYAHVKSQTEQYWPKLQIVDFLADQQVEVLGAADIVVSRASATTIQELAGLGKAVVAIPARALGDQHENAKVLVGAGAVRLLSDDELAEGRLAETLEELLSDSKARQELSSALHRLAKPHAAREVAEVILDVANVASKKRGNVT